MAIRQIEKIESSAISRDEFDEIVDLLEQVSQHIVELAGGYPAIISTEVHGRIIEAGVDDQSKPYLTVYKYGQLRRALSEAKQMITTGAFNNLRDAFHEALQYVE